MYEYICNFEGREKNAIGAFYRYKETISSKIPLTKHEIYLQLYNNYEHIHRLLIEELGYIK